MKRPLLASFALVSIASLVGCSALTEPNEYKVVKEDRANAGDPNGAAKIDAPSEPAQADTAKDEAKPGSVAKAAPAADAPADKPRVARAALEKMATPPKPAQPAHAHAPGGSCGE